MKKNLLTFTLLAATVFCTLKAQQINPVRCATTEHLQWLKSQDPNLESRMAAIENQTQLWIANHPEARTSMTTVTVPVIVHVVYNTPGQNISDDLIKSQIDVLNEDFGGYNSDITKVPAFFRGVKAGDTGIRFALATRDPSGNVTNGIRRISTSVSSWNTNNAVKQTSMLGDDAWPAASYLNIWVCNLGSNLLGYAQFPGGAASTDGVVILYSAFGRISSLSPYNYGRTVTHEVGHWWGLFHIWGDDGGSCSGTDQIADTPNQSDENYGADICAPVSCSNQPNGDMFMNYMDYVNDKNMYLFTAGQSVKIQATLNGSRAGLQTSLGLNVVTPATLDAGITSIISPSGIPCLNTSVSFIPQVTLKNFGSTALTTATINYKIDAGAVQIQAWSGNLATGSSINVSLGTMTSVAGDHLFYCWTSSPNGGTDVNTINDRTSINFIGHAVNAAFPISQSFDVSFPPPGWSVRNYDGTKNTTTGVTTCNTVTAWIKSTTVFHSGTGSAFYNNFAATSTQNGMIDDIITQTIDMTSAPTNAELSFWVAYAPKSIAGIDTLEVFATTDCGYTFTSIYKKWGTTLATAAATTSAYIPSAPDWRKETVSMLPYTGNPNLILVFRNTNHGGNNLYIDDLSIAVPTSVSEILPGIDLSIYPNPTHGLLNVSTNFDSPENMQILLVDALGQLVYKTIPQTTMGELTTIDMSSAAKGIYFLELKTGKGILVKKVSVTN